MPRSTVSPLRRRQLGVGPDAGGDDDHVAVEGAAVGEGDAGDPARRRSTAVGALAGVRRRCRAPRRCAQDRARLRVELLVHQVPRRRARRDRRARACCSPRAASSPSRPPPITTARSWSAARSRSMSRVSSIVRKPKTPVRSRRRSRACPRSCGKNGTAAGGDDQLVVAGHAAVVGVRPAWRSGRCGSTRTPACSVMPLSAYQRSGLRKISRRRPRRRTARGEHDPVVVAVRLVAEHRDVELLAAAAGEDLLDRAGAGHAVADDDQPLLRLVRPPPARGRRRPCRSSPSGRRDVQLEHGAVVQVLDDPQRDVHVGLRADREVAHRQPVADQHHA